MFSRTTSKAALILLVLLEGLLTLLLKVGIVLDTVLSLGLVGVEVLLVHHVGDRSPFGPFSVRVLCPRILLNTQMANDILHREFTPLMFQSGGKVPSGIGKLSDYAARDKLAR